MTKLSKQMNKEGKINTQVALYYLSSYLMVNVPPYGKERQDFIKRMKKEACGEKIGTYWYFSIGDLNLFADNVMYEV